jgi:serine/threonine protein kinase
MGQALHYLHTEKHLMHGDLKSANVLITGDFQAVFRIRILNHRIHMFLGFPAPDPDSLVRCMDPDPDPSFILLS